MFDFAVTRRTFSLLSLPSRRSFAKLLVAACVVFCSVHMQSQSSQQAPAAPAANTETQTQAKLPTVTTTVTVHGEAKDDYLPEAIRSYHRSIWSLQA